jgi:hypothetical protein
MTHSRATQISRLKRWQPNATDIRYEDKCPSCKRLALYSYILEGIDELRIASDGRQMQECGFWCGNCRWANAGARPVDEDGDDAIVG